MKRLVKGGLLLQWNDGLQKRNNSSRKANMFIDKLFSFFKLLLIRKSSVHAVVVIV